MPHTFLRGRVPKNMPNFLQNKKIFVFPATRLPKKNQNPRRQKFEKKIWQFEKFQQIQPNPLVNVHLPN